MILKGDCVDIHEYKKDEVVLSRHNANDCLIIIKSGQLLVSKADVMIKKLSKGDIFGVSTLFCEKENFQTTVTATQNSVLYFLPQSLITQLMNNDFSLAENYIKFLSAKIQYLNTVIDRYTGSNAEEKLAVYLLNKSTELSCDTFEISMSKAALSLNLGRASVYRALDNLIKSGIIEKSGKTVKISDPISLEKYIK
ncbi:MAG: Crp/Fnr family transcriptional regulator [Clostridia bacterium]|nr:Crp/Fnr family transcriptional regulator [Clostridia bacterium]